MENGEFEELVRRAVLALPKRFRKRMENVAIVIEDMAAPAEAHKVRARPENLLGLYEGVPKTAWGRDEMIRLPDKITLFRKVIEAEAGDAANVERVVKETIRHEVAHHFGMSDEHIHRLERSR